MDEISLRRRVRAVRKQMRRLGVDCLILTSTANVSYVTGFMGEDSWAAVTRNQVYLLTDSRYTEQAEGECPCCRIIERDKPLAETAAAILGSARGIQLVGLEHCSSLATFAKLKKCMPRKVRAVEDVLGGLRSCKGEEEAAAIRAAGAVAIRALRRAVKSIRPGITESELAGLIDLEVRRCGAKSSFETIVAFGANASRPHHQPGTRRLRRIDTILIDFGARYRGYCSDITRCFAIGRATKLYQKVYAAVKDAQAAAIREVRPGVTLKQVDSAAREVIRRWDLPVYGHGTGHGLGLEIHEEPYLKPQSKGVLKSGMVVTIEPGVYMPGKLGVRIEDDVLVTQDGCEVLTRRYPRQLRVLSL